VKYEVVSGTITFDLQYEYYRDTDEGGGLVRRDTAKGTASLGTDDGNIKMAWNGTRLWVEDPLQPRGHRPTGVAYPLPGNSSSLGSDGSWTTRPAQFLLIYLTSALDPPPVVDAVGTKMTGTFVDRWTTTSSTYSYTNRWDLTSVPQG
jgi:hypothetical protein